MYALNKKKNKQVSEANEQRERQQASVSTEAGYILRKNGRKVKNATFDTYEKARQEARRRIRKDCRGLSSSEKVIAFNWDSNPPAISEFGYSISRAG